MALRDSLKNLVEPLVALQRLAGPIEEGMAHLAACLRNGHRVAFCGNGGSAAIAQHLAAELVGRYQYERRALPALALSDPSVVTALGNDYGFDFVFSRQVEAHLGANDLLIAMSTSGQSWNVRLALEVARRQDVLTIALTGQGPNPASEAADLAICVPSTDTARIQECHLFIGHIWCQEVERRMVKT